MNNMEMMKFDNECQDALIKGVNLAADAISKTFGPNGTNVLIRTNSDVHITKDGATVADAVKHLDPFVSTGIELIRRISRQTADVVGDGSTTAAILARALVNKYSDTKNPIELSRQLSKDCQKVVEYLDQHKLMISSTKDLKKVATLSANNDAAIGSIVAEAFEKVGDTGVVLFKESEDSKDSLEYFDGFVIDSGYADRQFVNTANKTCELENVLVVISDKAITEPKVVEGFMLDALHQHKTLLLVAPDFESECKLMMTSNLSKLKSCAIGSPNFKYYREIMLGDMKSILGKSMTCKKVIVKDRQTIFIGCESNADEVAEKIIKTKELLNTTLSEFEEEFYTKRLANFTSGIATIYVGGSSSVERKERLDRVEDSIKATKASFKGILPGGGHALAQAFKNGIGGSLDSIIKTPYELLQGNSNIVLSKDFWEGTNWKTNESGNLLDMGIVEPFLVEKTALENAVNTASLILTCKCTILSFVNYE